MKSPTWAWKFNGLYEHHCNVSSVMGDDAMHVISSLSMREFQMAALYMLMTFMLNILSGISTQECTQKILDDGEHWDKVNFQQIPSRSHLYDKSKDEKSSEEVERKTCSRIKIFCDLQESQTNALEQLVVVTKSRNNRHQIAELEKYFSSFLSVCVQKHF
jgi:hypothetical protein